MLDCASIIMSKDSLTDIALEHCEFLPKATARRCRRCGAESLCCLTGKHRQCSKHMIKCMQTHSVILTSQRLYICRLSLLQRLTLLWRRCVTWLQWWTPSHCHLARLRWSWCTQAYVAFLDIRIARSCMKPISKSVAVRHLLGLLQMRWG